MNELELKYGCNPNQKPARVFMEQGKLPFKVLNGKPGYINLLDAMNSWQLVRELRAATNLPAAASFKHVSPAGAAVAVPLSEMLQKAYFVEGIELSPIATAYIRARGADRMSSYGDFVALSDECDAQTASFLKREVSDGIIAPSYSKAALEILMTKRKGTYLVLQMDPEYQPVKLERKQVFGVTFEQQRNEISLTGPEAFVKSAMEIAVKRGMKVRPRDKQQTELLNGVLAARGLPPVETPQPPQASKPPIHAFKNKLAQRRAGESKKGSGSGSGGGQRPTKPLANRQRLDIGETHADRSAQAATT